MPTYICNICNFSTKLKPHYSRHLNTQKHKRNFSLSNTTMVKNDETCIIFDHNLTIFDHNLTTNDHNLTTKKFLCEFCGKSLSTKGHLKRHIKQYCSKKKVPIQPKAETEILKNLLTEQQEMFDKERKNLYKQMDKLLDKVGNTTNIQSNIKNTIHLNSYGNEDMSHITDLLKNDLIKIPFEMIPKMIEAVHFNEEKPENNNISLSNIRDNKVKIYSDKGWVYKDKCETIIDLVSEKYFLLDNFYENNNKMIELNSKNNYVKFRDFFNTEDKEFVASLKKKCELVLLNNRKSA